MTWKTEENVYQTIKHTKTSHTTPSWEVKCCQLWVLKKNWYVMSMGEYKKDVTPVC